jgi:hypothetical protein
MAFVFFSSSDSIDHAPKLKNEVQSNFRELVTGSSRRKCCPDVHMTN